MQQREECSSEAELSEDKDVPAGVVCAGAHEVDKVRVPHFDQSCDLSLKLLRQVVFASVLAIVRKLQLLHGYVVFFVGRLEDVGTGASSDLLFKPDVLNIDSEVFLGFLELLTEDVTRLLGLCLRG